MLSCSEQPCGGDLNKLIRYYGSKKGPVEIGSHDWRLCKRPPSYVLIFLQQHFATGIEKSFLQVEIFLLFLGHGKGPGSGLRVLGPKAVVLSSSV